MESQVIAFIELKIFSSSLDKKKKKKKKIFCSLQSSNFNYRFMLTMAFMVLTKFSD